MDAVPREGIARVGKYRLIRELGRGGMGVVYLAEDSRLLREVALKVLHPALTLDTEFVTRFASEAQAIAALTHPGIVRVHAFEEVDGSHLIDMEYIDGRSLDHVLARGPLGCSDALDIVARVLEALAACHTRGMVHRDIKPSNILIAYDGRVLLSDFGLAMSCAFASVSAATSSCFIGTPKYASPESWDKAKPTPTGDVYSAGLVLLELLAGRTPFDGDSPLEIMRKTVAAARVPVREYVPQASDELVALLEDMLEAIPAKRPADATVALARLRATAEFAALPEGGAVTMRITPPAIRPKRKPAASRRRTWLIATTAAIVLAAGLVWRFQPGPDNASQTTASVGDVPAPTSPEAPSEPVPPPPVVSPNAGELAVVGDYVVFSGNTRTWRTLWSCNISTKAVAPVWPELTLGPSDSVFKDGGLPVACGIVGVVRSQAGGISLFRTDGTPEGTVVLAYAASTEANRIELLGARDGLVYFNRIGGDETFGLWETDGTVEGTRHRWGDATTPIVTQLQVAPSGGLYFASHTNGTIYSWPKGGAEPFPLWPAWSVDAFMGDIITLGDRVLADASSGIEDGRELWFADPTPGSLRKLRDIFPGNDDGAADPHFARFRDGVVFVGKTPGQGRELWFTDGTEAGTRLVFDINPGPMDSGPYRFTESGGLVYFSALSAQYGQELWVSDGTSEGTRRLTDINPGVGSTDPFAFCAFKGGLLFTPNDPTIGDELWFSEGTPEGTNLLYECVPGPAPSGPHGTQVIGDRAVFGADHPQFGRVLWVTDGTPEGTHTLFERLEAERSPLPEAAPWVAFGGHIYMANTSADHGTELWATDPDSAQSRLVRDIYPGPKGSNPHAFQEFNGYVYFAADDGIHGIELWRTDGTQDGTGLVYDAAGGAASGAPHDLTPWGTARLAFVADSGGKRGQGIFYCEIGTEGVRLAGGTDERGPQWKPMSLTDGGESWLVFSTQNAAGQTILWRTNGNVTQGLPALGRGATP